MTDKHIYLDNAATTPMSDEVLKAMLPYFKEKYGNPSSSHSKGYESKQAMDNARKTMAERLNCRSDEIIFTGSATEANNLAISGVAKKHQKGHIITSKIEHPSILETCRHLEKEGFKVTYLETNEEGFVDPDKLEKNITEDTFLVSIMYANNEIGTIEPIRKLAEICRKHAVPFHTDACQAANYLSLDTEKLGIDLMTINGGKIYGPKGIGVLYCNLDVQISPIIYGGGHEKGLRSGTENVASIVGMAKALEITQKTRENESKKLTKLQDTLIAELLKIPNTKLNGSSSERLPNNISISFTGFEARELLLHLDTAGIYASTGSACSGKKNEHSHVLKAIQCSDEQSKGSLRFSLGRHTTLDDIKYVLKKITELTKK